MAPRINRKIGKIVIRFLTESMYKKIVKRQPVRIMVGGEIVEIRSKHQKELKRMAQLRAEMKELKTKIK